MPRRTLEFRSRYRLVSTVAALALLLGACSHDDVIDTGDGGHNSDEIDIDRGGADDVGEEIDGLYVVRDGDTLTEIVRDECGVLSDELLFNVVDANRNNQQADGEYLTDINRIEAGWILEIPCELPPRPLIECPDGSDTAFLAQGDEARVALCQTGDSTEYFGQRLSDRASIILDACVRPDGLVEALNAGPTVDTYYLVSIDGSTSVEVWESPKGRAPLEGRIVNAYDLDVQHERSTNLRSCTTEAPPPVEEIDVVYPEDPAPLTTVTFDRSVAIPDDVACDELGLGTSAVPMLSLGEPTSADPNRWIQQRQGERLRLGNLPPGRSLTLSGGGHSWPLQPTRTAEIYQIDITDAHPLGRYLITVDGDDDEVAGRIEIIRQPELRMILDHDASAGDLYVYRIYGLSSGVEVGLEVSQQNGCQGTVWHRHQSVGAPDRNGSDVAMLEIDMRGAPTRTFCLTADGRCGSTMVPGL